MKKTTSGFTIVELLIVIVVIAILAAISVVAYTGIQNRTHDSSVQSDLRQFAQKISLYYAEEGSYPTNLSQIQAYGTITVSKDSYAEFFYNTESYNYIYCWNNTSKEFALGARSRSGAYFQYRDGKVSSYTGSSQIGPLSAVLCSNLGASSASRMWLYDGIWRV